MSIYGVVETMAENKINQSEKMNFYDSMSESDYRKIKVRLQELQQKRKGKSIKLLSFVVSGISMLVSLFSFFYIYDEITIPNVVISAVVSATIAGFFVAYLGLFSEMRESTLRRKILEYEAEHIKEDVEEDVFENSIKMSYKYLDQYYLQTREQAHRGFLVTVCVAIFGALLIGVGIVAMFLGLAQPSIITCAAGIITEFIAAVFFYLYNRTISSMSKYHNKLVLSQNISIALKIADSLPEEDNAKAKNLIVTELLKDINNHLIKDDLGASK